MTTANKVLIVDDDSDILDFLIDILKDDISMSFAPNGAKALEIANTLKPDLILLDVDMPDLNGFEVCQLLKDNPVTQNIPVIFLTAMNKEQDLKEGLRLGAVDYITKPFDPDIVIAKVKNQLNHIAGGRKGSLQEPAKSRSLPTFAMALIVLVLIGGGLFLGVDEMLEMQEVSSTPEASAPAVAPPTPPAPTPKTPVPAVAPAATSAQAWPLNSTCAKPPVVSWWGTTTHSSLVNYVKKHHDGNWVPYIDKWVNQMNKMQSVYDRAGSAKISDGTVLRGERLLEHVDNLKKRIAVINCLATESLTAK